MQKSRNGSAMIAALLLLLSHNKRYSTRLHLTQQEINIPFHSNEIITGPEPFDQHHHPSSQFSTTTSIEWSKETTTLECPSNISQWRFSIVFHIYIYSQWRSSIVFRMDSIEMFSANCTTSFLCYTTRSLSLFICVRDGNGHWTSIRYWLLKESSALAMLPLAGCELKMAGGSSFTIRHGHRLYSMLLEREELLAQFMAALDLASNAAAVNNIK